MKTSKYIVFNRDDFNAAIGWVKDPDLEQLELFKEVEDVISFRLQDRFVAPAIQAYLDSVCNVLEVLEEFGMPDENQTIEDLTMIRDWAETMTTRARGFKEKKIPDA
jgi:hypothetical protein